MFAEVDCYHQLTESNESNNTRYESYQIAVVGFKVIRPNGGEEMPVDSNSVVEWQTYGSIPTVNLDVSLDNGATWNVLQSGLSNVGQYEWTVTENWVSPTCLIRVLDASNASISDVSDGAFQIFVCTLLYDLDGDCHVNLSDLALLATEWLKSGNPYQN